MSKLSKYHYKTVFMSDVHLGTPDSKATEATEFLKRVRCETLILNGDIIDGWQLKRGGQWQDNHTRFVRMVLKKMEKEHMQVIYLRGNHDDILERFLPVGFGRLSIVHEYVHETPKGNYLVVHGDGFDSVTTDHKFIAVAGSVGYGVLLRINRLYNQWREWRGKGYFSLSKEIKAKVKMAVNHLSRFEEQLCSLANLRDCVGVICGHIHTPEDRRLDGIHYLNSGDWVESLTAIVESKPGEFEVVEYGQFLSELDELDEDRYDLEDAGTRSVSPAATLPEKLEPVLS